MYGDFSRVLDPRSSHYSAVLAQQGRLLLDAELNEQTAITLDYLRGLVSDILGPFAGPHHHCGFAVAPVFDGDECVAVRLTAGHYYVYGLRCESPGPHASDADELPIDPSEAPFVVFLSVWEQSVGAIQAPDLAEPALGREVSDTVRRSQVRWRPQAGRRLAHRDADLTELKPKEIVRRFHEYHTDPPRPPLLAARAHGAAAEDGQATLPALAAYRGVENQLYRVEVHEGGSAEQATFKWSRENGSVEVALRSLSEGEDGVRTAHMGGIWLDDQRGVEAGDWVELVDDRWAPFDVPPPLMQIESVSLARRELTVRDHEANRDFDEELHPFLRRWDQDPHNPGMNHGIPVSQAEGKWFELEDGVQIQFFAHGGHYQRGDFWVIPARATTGDVLWPRTAGHAPAPLALEPAGPARYLAPLALVTAADQEPVDLRTRFKPRFDEDGESETTRSHVVRPYEPQAITPRAYVLRSVSTVAPRAQFELGERTVLGRASEADITLSHDDISREHACVLHEGDTLTIEDLGSTNGTWLNAQRLEPHVPVTAAPGDVITIGSASTRFVIGER